MPHRNYLLWRQAEIDPEHRAAAKSTKLPYPLMRNLKVEGDWKSAYATAARSPDPNALDSGQIRV
jgi:hypothetical protein